MDNDDNPYDIAWTAKNPDNLRTQKVRHGIEKVTIAIMRDIAALLGREYLIVTVMADYKAGMRIALQAGAEVIGKCTIDGHESFLIKFPVTKS